MWGHTQAVPFTSCVISLLRLSPLLGGVDISSDLLGWV